jgi:hypothetical protein
VGGPVRKEDLVYALLLADTTAVVEFEPEVGDDVQACLLSNQILPRCELTHVPTSTVIDKKVSYDVERDAT